MTDDTKTASTAPQTVDAISARLDHQFANAVCAPVVHHRAHGQLVGPHVHEGGVRHFFAGEHAGQFRQHGVFG